MEMYYKRDGIIVEVYKFFENGSALIFSPSMAGKQNGNGWERIKVSQLIPLNYYNENKKGFMSKTERNKIKERLTLSSAQWTCSDGIVFNDCDKAIKHEYEIMTNEKNKEDNV